MPGVSPDGVAENGTRSGKASFDVLFMRLIFSNLLPCLPSLAAGLVPAGQHYYEGSDFCQPLPQMSPTTVVSLSLSIRSLIEGAWNWIERRSSSLLLYGSFSAFCCWQISLLISIELMNIPSPTTLLPFHPPRFDTLPGSGHRAGCRTDRRDMLGRAVLIVGPLRAVKGS